MHPTPEPASLAVRSTKLPADVAARLDALADARHVSVSACLRALVEAAVAEDAREPGRGPVESEVLAEIEDMSGRVAPGRVAVALELARQLDSTRTNSPAVAGQIRLLLAEMREHSAAGAPRFTRLHLLRLQLALAGLGFTLTDDTGREFDANHDWPAAGGDLERIVS